MPKQKRWEVKRECDRAAEDIIRAQTHVVRAFGQYEEPHPDIFRQAASVVQALETAKDLILMLRDRI